jgi:2-polyprenyl-6-methoxyphenol hydroxylase-like FAD-dependent oxidoreductase
LPLMVQQRKVIISGAGIAGLSLSIYLSRAGFDVLILEKDSTFRISVAGIHLWNSGLRILHELGINDIEGESASCDTIRMVNQPSGREGIFLTPAKNHSITAARSIVHQKLLEAARKCNNVEIRMDCEILRMTRGTPITIDLSTGETWTCDILIAADGINSGVRRLLGLDTNRVYQGYLGLGVVYPGELTNDFSIFTGEMGMVGMSNLGTMGTNQKHKFLWSHLPMSENHARLFAKEPLLSIGAMTQFYAAWGKEVQDEFAEIEGNLKHCQWIGCLPIYVKPPLTNWVYDSNIVLIGDASHAYGPGGMVEKHQCRF